jgi:hypothetical protein
MAVYGTRQTKNLGVQAVSSGDGHLRLKETTLVESRNRAQQIVCYRQKPMWKATYCDVGEDIMELQLFKLIRGY